MHKLNRGRDSRANTRTHTHTHSYIAWQIPVARIIINCGQYSHFSRHKNNNNKYNNRRAVKTIKCRLQFPLEFQTRKTKMNWKLFSEWVERAKQKQKQSKWLIINCSVITKGGRGRGRSARVRCLRLFAGRAQVRLQDRKLIAFRVTWQCGYLLCFYLQHHIYCCCCCGSCNCSLNLFSASFRPRPRNGALEPQTRKAIDAVPCRPRERGEWKSR